MGADDGRRNRKRRNTRPAGQRGRRAPRPQPAGEVTPQEGNKAPHNTSWDPVASWYTGWAGKGGSIYHRRVALPTVMRLAAPVSGEKLLDIGSGHGVLAGPVLKSGASYTGVDFSPKLVQAAAESNPKAARFLHGDARKLLELPGIGAGSQDVAVFMLSIQDMDPLSEILQQATAVLRPGGRLVVFMLHPAFRVPRGSGWGTDENRKLKYRRVDHYLNELAVPMKAFSEAGNVGRRGTTWSFHRPLAAYFDGMFRGGLVLDAFEELPDPLEKQATLIPMFTAFRGRKLQPGQGVGRR